MSENMVERVARAIWEAQRGEYDEVDCVPLARAAIAAMREITEKVADDGLALAHKAAPFVAYEGPEPRIFFQSVIDAALKDTAS